MTEEKIINIPFRHDHLDNSYKIEEHLAIMVYHDELSSNTELCSDKYDLFRFLIQYFCIRKLSSDEVRFLLLYCFDGNSSLLEGKGDLLLNTALFHALECAHVGIDFIHKHFPIIKSNSFYSRFIDTITSYELQDGGDILEMVYACLYERDLLDKLQFTDGILNYYFRTMKEVAKVKMTLSFPVILNNKIVSYKSRLMEYQVKKPFTTLSINVSEVAAPLFQCVVIFKDKYKREFSCCSTGMSKSKSEHNACAVMFVMLQMADFVIPEDISGSLGPEYMSEAA